MKKSGFYPSVGFASVSLMLSAPAGAQEQTTPVVPDGLGSQPPIKPERITLPGEFALRTRKGYYVTAISGGGRTIHPVVVTGATSAGPWEKFRLGVMDPPPPYDKSLQTSGGYYVTAVNGGGLTSDVLYTDATQARDWEHFHLYDLGEYDLSPTYFAIQTVRRNYLTAVGEGGKYDNAIHTDATQIGPWEYFRIVKCGELGSGYQYTIITAGDDVLYAEKGGGESGESNEVINRGGGQERGARFRFIRQSDGSYALQTSNGVNYVTALGGGGKDQEYLCKNEYWPPWRWGACRASFSAIFHTDATQVQAWERFKIIDQGNCKYAIQTTSGFYVGILKDPSHSVYLLTTRQSTISENEKFQLVMYGLNSPPISGPFMAPIIAGPPRK